LPPQTPIRHHLAAVTATEAARIAGVDELDLYLARQTRNARVAALVSDGDSEWYLEGV